MYNNTGRTKNIELPENLFSNLGELKHKHQLNFKPTSSNQTINYDQSIATNQTLSKENKSSINNYIVEPKLTNLSNKQKYRKRIDNIYKEINNLKPIDNEIDNVIYFNNYLEKGIVIKPKISSLKQFWTEYRLINNEKNVHKNDNLTNFDELFNQLSKRVEEINRYIDELKEMRTSIDISSSELEAEKNKLKEEKKEFISYKQTEEQKIKAEKESLKINYDRLQTIINDLDKKLTEIEN